MKKSCASAPRKRAQIRTVKVGSVHVKIYTGTLKQRPCFTVYWRVGERPYRKLFADLTKAEGFAKEQAERLAAGQVDAPAISVTEVQTFREAQRRLGPAAAALITLVPLLIVGWAARAFCKLNFMSLCGLLAGSMTDPPALAFANAVAAPTRPRSPTPRFIRRRCSCESSWRRGSC